MNTNISLDCPIQFPEDGLMLKNRLVKAAMVEGLASIYTGQPNDSHYRLYKRWADAGFGMIISGNVCIANDHLGTPGDLRLPIEITELTLEPWRRLAQSMIPSLSSSSSCNASTIGILQLVHTGRQSVRCAGRFPLIPPIAPSSIRVSTNPNNYISKIVERLTFQTPKTMTINDIEHVIDLFRKGAKLAYEAGFNGIQLHASHGYLLSSFLSPRTNLREDNYGGSPENRLRIIIEIIDRIRGKYKQPFIVGIKLNSTDFIDGGLDEKEALKHIELLTRHGGVDFIEISGGSYENIVFLADESPRPGSSSRTQHREAIFAAFSSQAKQVVVKAAKEQQSGSGSFQSSAPRLIMCTGGFRTRNGIEHALREDGIDLIGIGRPAASDPEWIERLLGLSESAARGKKQHNTDSCVPFKVSGGRWLMRLVPLKLVGGGLTTLWHELQMSRMGRGEKTKVEWSFERLLIVEFLHSSMAYFVGIAILVTVLAVYVAYQ